MLLSFSHKGDFSKTASFLEKVKTDILLLKLDVYGRQGVKALSQATPVDTGRTAESWYYTVKRTDNRISLEFHNSNVNKGIPIAVILQYGHATRNGGWVQGRDYINPAIQPIFDKIAKSAWEEVNKK